MDFEFLRTPAHEAAQLLLGCILEREIDGKLVRVRIVETEAYDQIDIASHSYNGETPRTKVMFGEPGHLYVYFTYGMHYCCNIVVGSKGHGSAVLIRAVEPLVGKEIMETKRGRSGVQISNGPAKLCQALSIDKQLNGHNLNESPLKLSLMPILAKKEIIQTTRVGIARGKDVPWRFYIKNNPFVSTI